MKTIHELFETGKVLLGRFSDSSLESRLLLCKSISISQEDFYAEGASRVSREQERTFLRLVAQRQSGIPLAYLTNVKEFWSIPFEVYPGVLIPRPETELVVEKVIELSSGKKQVIVDIGTGSGNIAIALARELSETQIIATDVSPKAIKVAKLNASKINVSNVSFERGSFFSPLEELNLRRKCDFIVSNPPYVSKKEWGALQSEVRDYEPKNALVAGESGIEFIKKLVKGAPKYLKSGGYFVFEMGWGQRKQVMELFDNRWNRVRSFNDLNDTPRVIVARKKI